MCKKPSCTSNPVALLPQCLQKILDLEVVVMSDILPDDTPIQIPRHLPPSPKKPIQAILLWVEKYSTLAATFFSCFPEKEALFLSGIYNHWEEFDLNRWVAYDRCSCCYRRERLWSTNILTAWSQPQAVQWSINRSCKDYSPAVHTCLQEDHASFHALTTKPVHGSPGCLTHSSLPHPHPTQPGITREVRIRYNDHPHLTQPSWASQKRCIRYNDGRSCSTASTCKYIHKCLECWGSHPKYHCPAMGLVMPTLGLW